MKVTVCEMTDSAEGFARDWQRLAAHVRAEASDLVLLPEMPFFPWFALTPQFDAGHWQVAVAAHAAWLERLPELAPAVVLGTRPVEVNGRRLNEGFVWEASSGYRIAHYKYYLPEDPGFWEASWYERGDGDFTPIDCGPVRVGFQVCTELWFFQHSRAYGKAGAHIIACPRSTPLATADKWLAGGRTAGVVAGAYCLSSNHAGLAGDGSALGGLGWVTGTEGQVLGVTTPEKPFVTVEIDLGEAELAKNTYPRYVKD